jgi:hypothetical protein
MKPNTTTPRSRALRQYSLIAVLISVPVQGDIIPISQTRTLDTGASVSSPGGGSSDSDQAEAMDFGPFVRSIQSSAFGGASASGSASQNSSITVSGFSAIGSAGAGASGGNDFAQPGGSGRSTFILEFDLTAPGTVSGTFGRQTSGFAFASSGMSISGVGSFFSSPVSVDLPAGNYTITIEASASAGSMNFETASASASFNIQLVPEPSTLLLVVGAVGLLRLRR